MKINIQDFMQQYATAGVPEEVWCELRQRKLRGETEADVRDTLIDEIKIEQFYRAHPELRPHTDYRAVEFSRIVIDLMKDALSHRDESADTLKNVQKQLAIELDRRKVNNLSTDEIASLYDDVLWLRTEILKL